MEDEIKVGEYVRTRKGIAKIKGKIGQIWDKGIAYEVDKNGTVIADDSFSDFIYETDIVKHSLNIIDLIEVNDYVNGRKVKKVFIDPFNKKKRLELEGTEINWQGDMSTIYCEAEDIKTIVTHEQMASIEYKVKE